MTTRQLSSIAVSSFALLLASCGGGGGGTSGPTIPIGGGGGGSGDPTWTQGQFQPASNFKSRCEVPRAGSDDRAGSYLFEKHWLRSWSNETYLWYNEIPDINPANSDYPFPIDYFDILKTDATTASGAPQDRFHFTFDTEEYDQLVNSGASAGYGARIALLDTTPPDREAVIAFAEAGSPAANAGMTRGTQIIEVDGTPIADGDADALNAGLFPASEGESHTFLIRKPGSTVDETVSVTSAIVERQPVHTQTTDTLPNGDTVGYVLFNTFGTRSAESALFDAFESFEAQNIDHLVLDLRYNGGGFLDISAELGYMIAGSNTNGHDYETLVFNDKNPTTNPVTGERLEPTPFYSMAQGFSVNSGTRLPTVNLDTVYILSTSGTCSASESLINGLEGADVNVVLIGTTTCGKPYGFYATDNCGTTYFTIQFRGENDKGFGDYADGFSPFEGSTTTGEPVDGCILADDFSTPLGNTGEALYSAALNHIETGNCPAGAAADTRPPAFKNFEPIGDAASGDLLADENLRRRLILDNTRILGRPE